MNIRVSVAVKALSLVLGSLFTGTALVGDLRGATMSEKRECSVVHYFYGFRCTRTDGHTGRHAYYGCHWPANDVDPESQLPDQEAV
ncbi:hypothetical protein BKG82_23005 [Mycobacteroides chelonae]|uniref:Uncharacterized protein n=2 Tax=Mycobacteroides chelonae TaxID=1774 RepID=A0A1S1LJZ1_MYCCH|nr:hypothetical protein BKG82_23005 [Mycobacteroides chelonae]